MTKHSVVNGYQGSSYLHLQIIQLSRKGRYIYKALHIPPEEKSHGVRSGDVGGHCRNTQSVWLEHLNCLSGRGVCRYCLTLRHPWSGAPSCWKIKSEDSSSCNFSINQFCSMIRYTSPFTVPSSKKNGPYTRFFDMAQNTFTLGESRTCSRLTWGFPYACVMIVNFTTYVEGHLIAKNKSNLSSSNLSSISVQNLWRIGLSVSFNCWINCCLYGVNCSHLFKTCQTVADGSWSSQLAMLNDLCESCAGRLAKLVQPYQLKLWGVLFSLPNTNTSSSLNFACQFKMERQSGACLVKIVRNLHWTCVHDPVLAYCRTQNDFSCFVNDITGSCG